MLKINKLPFSQYQCQDVRIDCVVGYCKGYNLMRDCFLLFLTHLIPINFLEFRFAFYLFFICSLVRIWLLTAFFGDGFCIAEKFDCHLTILKACRKLCFASF